MQQPLNTYWKAIKKILRYLKDTIDFDLSFTRFDNLGLTGYLNVDWGSDPDNRRSTTGFYVYTLVTTLFHGLQRSNILFPDLTPKLGIKVWLLQPLKFNGYNHCYQNFRFLN